MYVCVTCVFVLHVSVSGAVLHCSVHCAACWVPPLPPMRGGGQKELGAICSCVHTVHNSVREPGMRLHLHDTLVLTATSLESCNPTSQTLRVLSISSTTQQCKSLLLHLPDTCSVNAVIVCAVA